MRIALTLALTLSCFTGFCCLQEYRTRLNGQVVYDDPWFKAKGNDWWGNDTTFLMRELREADSIYRKTGRLKDYSDYGIQLIYSNRLAEAKKVFQEIEHRYPSLYHTAANLGTTYELLGQNDSALYWISKAVKINPSSHDSSEWIHVKILEAKIASKGDTSYFHKHSILGLDFGDAVVPDTTKYVGLDGLAYEIYYQLCERMTFVKPKDPVVAQLLFDLGNVTAVTQEVETALENYQKAAEYGFSSEVMERRSRYFKELHLKAEEYAADKASRESAQYERRARYRRDALGGWRPSWYVGVLLGGAVLAIIAYVAKRKTRPKP